MLLEKLLCFGIELSFVLYTYCQITFQEKENEARKKLFTPSALVVDESLLAPTVFIAIFVRNKEHTLPYFLNALYNLNYPKDRVLIR